jgi:hypothetical protein
MNEQHPYLSVIREMLEDHAINSEEATSLVEAVSSLNAPLEKDLQLVIEHFPYVQLIVGTVKQRLNLASQQAEREVDENWDERYRYFADNRNKIPGGKLTAEAIHTAIRLDPVHKKRQLVWDRLRYFVACLSELQEVFQSRRRMLEQYSNNRRQYERHEQGDDR